MNSKDLAGTLNYDDGLRFSTGIGPRVDKFLNGIIDKISTDEFRENLSNKIVGPITDIVNQKIKPYIYIGIGLYVILLVLLLIIIYMLYKKNKL